MLTARLLKMFIIYYELRLLFVKFSNLFLPTTVERQTSPGSCVCELFVSSY